MKKKQEDDGGPWKVKTAEEIRHTRIALRELDKLKKEKEKKNG